MRMLTIIPVLNRFDMVRDTLKHLEDTTEVSIVAAIDNGSRQPLGMERWLPRNLTVWRNAENTGNYPIFTQGLIISRHDPDTEILAFLHSDMFIYERGWDLRVIEAFKADHRLGLIGFIGSNEIDANGGRGLGTVSNFQGLAPNTGAAEIHGKRIAGTEPAAVVDGCMMIFRRQCLEDCGFEPDFPPHHFYDRLMSCQAREKGWRMATMGIACDHLSNQTVAHEQAYHELAEAWCKAQERPIELPEGGGWDLAVYREAERQWLTVYRDQRHLVPVHVDAEYRETFE